MKPRGTLSELKEDKKPPPPLSLDKVALRRSIETFLRESVASIESIPPLSQRQVIPLRFPFNLYVLFSVFVKTLGPYKY